MNHYAKVTFRCAVVIWAIVFLLMCTGCSALAPLATEAVVGAVTEDKPLVGIDTEIVAGDKQGIKSGPDTKIDDTEVHGNLTTTTTGKQTEVTGNNDVVNLNEGVPYEAAFFAALLALVVGLYLPQYRFQRKQ